MTQQWRRQHRRREACCLDHPDRQALTDLVSSLAYEPMLMSVVHRLRMVGEQRANTRCTFCGKLRMMCVGGCDLIPVPVWRVPSEG